MSIYEVDDRSYPGFVCFAGRVSFDCEIYRGDAAARFRQSVVDDITSVSESFEKSQAEYHEQEWRFLHEGKGWRLTKVKADKWKRLNDGAGLIAGQSWQWRINRHPAGRETHVIRFSLWLPFVVVAAIGFLLRPKPRFRMGLRDAFASVTMIVVGVGAFACILQQFEQS